MKRSKLEIDNRLYEMYKNYKHINGVDLFEYRTSLSDDIPGHRMIDIYLIVPKPTMTHRNDNVWVITGRTFEDYDEFETKVTYDSTDETKTYRKEGGWQHHDSLTSMLVYMEKCRKEFVSKGIDNIQTGIYNEIFDILPG